MAGISVRPIDPAKSRVVLLGTPVYDDPDLPDVPQIAANLADLAALLTNPRLGGFPPEHVVTVPPSAPLSLIGDVLDRATAQAEDLLLFYFAGHGLVGPQGDLYLGLAETRHQNPAFSALHFEAVREIMRARRTRAANRMVVIDSCFSGRAIKPHLGTVSATALIGRMEIEGTYILTSSPPNKAALVQPGERNTAFTGRLLALLRDGDPQLGGQISFGDLFPVLRRHMAAEGLPVPQQAGTGTSALLGLVPNRSYVDPSRRETATADHRGRRRRVDRRRRRTVQITLMAAVCVAAVLGAVFVPGFIRGGSNAADAGTHVTTSSPKWPQSEYSKIYKIKLLHPYSTVTQVFGQPSLSESVTASPESGGTQPVAEHDFVETWYWMAVYTDESGSVVQYAVYNCDPQFHPSMPIDGNQAGVPSVTLDKTTFGNVHPGVSVIYTVPADTSPVYEEDYPGDDADNNVTYELGATYSCSGDTPLTFSSPSTFPFGFSCPSSPLRDSEEASCGKTAVSATELQQFRSQIPINAWSACYAECLNFPIRPSPPLYVLPSAWKTWNK